MTWRCSACNKLIYNLDAEGNPCEGAPDPRYLSPIYKECCNVCFELGSIIRDSTYFLGLHNREAAITQRILGGNPTA